MATLQYLTTTQFDFGAIGQLPRALKQLGIKRPFLATDKGLMAVGLASRVRAAMGEDLPVAIFDGTPENPTEEAVLEGVSLYKNEECDGVVALGGGSPMDLGKAVAFMATHDGQLADYTQRGAGAKIKPIAPLIAIPTTAGTGSEVSVGFVVIVQDGRKLTFVHPHFIPKIAICDPDLTLGLPKGLTAATGMDAVTHCIEAILSPVVNPPAEAVGYDGLYRALSLGNLERAVSDGSDKDARWQMMMASTQGAMAFIKGLGAVHAMSHSAGRLKDLRLHHGTLNAVILPTILRFNADHVGDKYDRIRHAIKLAPSTDLADYIEDLNAKLGLPKNLGEMGLTMDRLPDLVPEAAKDLASGSNPRKASEDDYARLYEDAIQKS